MLAVRDTGPVPVLPAGELPGGVVSGRRPADRGMAQARAGWWQAWRARFGLAEVCGTAAALSGFAAGYLPDRSLLAAAALATL